MARTVFLLLHLHLLLLLLGLAARAGAVGPPGPAGSFVLGSPDVPAGGRLAATFAFDEGGCGGANRSPALAWSGAPAGTRSFALTVLDPDAPGGAPGFRHWVVLDLPASATALARGAGRSDGRGLPAGARQLRNDFDLPGWGGPCPPPGPAHRYVFTIHALKVQTLGVRADVDTPALLAALRAARLGEAGVTAGYAR